MRNYDNIIDAYIDTSKIFGLKSILRAFWKVVGHVICLKIKVDKWHVLGTPRRSETAGNKMKQKRIYD